MFFKAVPLHADESVFSLEGYLQDLETFSAVFEQTILNNHGEELEKSAGEVFIKKPGMFRWEYEIPYIQHLISDGSNLWVYDEDLEQVSIRTIATLIDDSPAAILGGEVEIHKHYVISETEDAEKTSGLNSHRRTLTPSMCPYV